MPELPEVEIFRRLVERHCLGRVVERAQVEDPGMLEAVSAASLKRHLDGAALRSSERRGKHLFIGMDRGGFLALHFGTNGSLRLVASGEPDPDFARLRLDFADGDRLVYVNPRRLGGVSITDSIQSFAAAAGLGPDVLDPAFDFPAFAQALRSHRRDIKSVLMDQSVMAGIGNIYSDEILFQAAIHPATAADALGGAEAKRLFRSMRSVIETATEHGAGSESGIDRLPRGFLLPERRRGGRCPRCGGPVAAVKRAGRTAYFCPRCQPAPA